jgi:hypothetical protein
VDVINVGRLDDVEEDLRKMRISGWRGKARRRDELKSVLREVKVLQGHRVQVQDFIKDEVTQGRGNFIIKTFMVCTLHQILLEWLDHGR